MIYTGAFAAISKSNDYYLCIHLYYSNDSATLGFPKIIPQNPK
jgi:hypothetical protein